MAKCMKGKEGWKHRKEFDFYKDESGAVFFNFHHTTHKKLKKKTKRVI